MSHGSELKSRGAMALRAAGFKPCPRWWLTQEQLDLLEYMAKQNEDIVNQIRAEAYRPSAMTEEDRKRLEMEAAWRELERRRLEGGTPDQGEAAPQGWTDRSRQAAGGEELQDQQSAEEGEEDEEEQ